MAMVPSLFNRDRAYQRLSIREQFFLSRRGVWLTGLVAALLVAVVGVWLRGPQSRALRVRDSTVNLLTEKEDAGTGLNAGSGGAVASGSTSCNSLFCKVSKQVQSIHLPWMPVSTTTTTSTVTSSITTTTTSSSTYTGTTTTYTNTSTTTTTTTTGCRTAVVGERCHNNVMAAMQHPHLYSLTRNSTFEEFQERVSKDPDTHCHLPCPCHTAEQGEHCYDDVEWARTKGIPKHPEWFPNLTRNSSFEEVQNHMHKFDNKSTCPSPCVAALSRFMTFFCFSIIRSTGYEPGILRNQFAWNAGIFACEDYAVLSDKKVTLGWTTSEPVETLPFMQAEVGISKDGTAGNALLFMRAWDAVKTSTNYDKHDWILKVDPDAVLIPDRLRMHLTPFKGNAIYVRNCNRYPGPGWPMMFGSVEIFSRKAIQTYFEGKAQCKKYLGWKAWGEDYFMGHCLDYLGVGTSDDYGVVSDALCLGGDCSNPWAASFHPFKSTVKWMECWKQATGKGKFLEKPPDFTMATKIGRSEEKEKTVWVK